MNDKKKNLGLIKGANVTNKLQDTTADPGNIRDLKTVNDVLFGKYENSVSCTTKNISYANELTQAAHNSINNNELVNAAEKKNSYELDSSD